MSSMTQRIASGAGLPVITHESVAVREGTQKEKPYDVVLFDDPVTSVFLVIVALVTVFGYSKEKAIALVSVAEENGRAVVWTGEKKTAEEYCIQLHRYLLTAVVSSS